MNGDQKGRAKKMLAVSSGWGEPALSGSLRAALCVNFGAVYIHDNMAKTRTSHIADLMGSKWWLWLSCFAGTALIHLGTAILRLNSFFPFPQALDFSSYYAAAWSTRLKLSPYPWSEDLLKFLAETQNLAITPPIHNSLPLWSWLLQPITILPFPSAAILWLFFLLILVVYCHVVIMRIAGYKNWKVVALTLPITLTFGPLFLNLTLGQNGIFLLLSVLLMGKTLKNGSGYLEISALVTWVVAVGAKIYPVLWIGCLPLFKRWRTFAIAIVLVTATFGFLALLEPEINFHYWFTFLPNQTREFASRVSIDDQSLCGFLTRIGTSNSYTFPGLDIKDSHEVTWYLPWNFSTQSIRYFSSVLILILGGWLMFSWIRNNTKDPDGILYSLALYSLLLFPHMERYNHILALPAMAWLWKQKTLYRNLTVVAYGMFGLSRLNHLWVLFPSPIGPLLSGFGLFGVLILMLALSHSLIQHKSTRRTGQVE